MWRRHELERVLETGLRRSATWVSLTLALALSAPLGAQTVPTPESSLGFQPGADLHLANYDESIEYFEALDAASDALQLVEVGRTSEGRTWYMALVSAPENLADIERLRDIAQQIAHPRDVTEAAARLLAREGKAFVDINGGLHASEVAGAQHTIQLAYDLVSGADDPNIARILDNVVVALWPSLNPDGQNIVVDWYRGNVGTPFEVAPLVELYQKYIGHDNNRDAYMLNMVESRVIARTWRQWEPQIVYVHHQTAPFPTRIWLPPFAEPIATQAPPLMSRTVNTIGMAIAQLLEARNQPGATHLGTGFDAWYPGYIDYLPMLQNVAAFWTETALYRYATPHFYTVRDFPEARQDLRPESLYSSPWPGGWWRLRDAVDYMTTASIAVLDYAARYKEEVLFNRYQSGRRVIEKYLAEPPYAYLIPVEQRDAMAPVALLQRLAFNGVRVHRLTADTLFDGREYAAGTWIIPMDQEFAELARQLLDVQTYPDLREFPEGPPEQPYDAAGWTLPYQLGATVHAVDDALDRRPASRDRVGAGHCGNLGAERHLRLRHRSERGGDRATSRADLRLGQRPEGRPPREQRLPRCHPGSGDRRIRSLSRRTLRDRRLVHRRSAGDGDRSVPLGRAHTGHIGSPGACPSRLVPPLAAEYG